MERLRIQGHNARFAPLPNRMRDEARCCLKVPRKMALTENTLFRTTKRIH